MKWHRKVVFACTAALLLLWGSNGYSQQRLWRIAFLTVGTSESTADWLAAFRQGMKDLGRVEGRDFVLDSRYGNGKMAALPKLSDELVATEPDVILTTSEGSIRPIAQRTKSIPIVFAVASDPVGLGFAKSLQRPGGNLTGLTNFTPELGAKRLQLLKETLPLLSHAILVYESDDASSLSQVQDIEKAAASLAIRVTKVPIAVAADIENAFKRRGEAGTYAYIMTTGPLFNIHRHAIAEQLLRTKAPSTFSHARYVLAGGLMSYAPSYIDNFRRAAVYVDKILQGKPPAELPIETPTKYELLVNAKTARAIGLTIPPSILARADKVIE